jgi:hypothetical protein
MNATLSFQARSAVAAFKLHRDVNRLGKSLADQDYSAYNARGETLLDIADRMGHRRTIVALEKLGVWRTH